MTSLEQIITIVSISAPAIVTMITSIILSIINKVTVKSVSTKIEEMKAEVKSSKEYTELKAQHVLVHQENIALKKKLNELLTKIDKVVRNESDDEQTNQTV